jgi:protein tyrosine phosphatase (PTP) superfamily phosphohydrolase (DUF442 family)/cytochrome c556
MTIGFCSSLLVVLALWAPPPPSMSDDAAKDLEGLHNVVAYHEGFWSGGVPEGKAGFEQLRSMGVKTIISVDGAVPDLELAKSMGMRYVHLPIGYDGFDDARKAELVRAVRDLPKPIYLHCHHGKHRSAGAAAAVAVSLGWMTNEQAAARMKVSGTAAGYKGLWSCAAKAAPMAAAVIDAASASFPEVTRPESFVASMVAIDEAFDRLKLAEKAGWKAPADHPDLAPIADAGKLADLFRLIDEASLRKCSPEGADELKSWMARSATAAAQLEAALERAGKTAPEGPDAASQRAAATALMAGLAADCKACHAKYRD